MFQGWLKNWFGSHNAEQNVKYLLMPLGRECEQTPTEGREQRQSLAGSSWETLFSTSLGLKGWKCLCKLQKHRTVWFCGFGMILWKSNTKKHYFFLWEVETIRRDSSFLNMVLIYMFNCQMQWIPWVKVLVLLQYTRYLGQYLTHRRYSGA